MLRLAIIGLGGAGTRQARAAAGLKEKFRIAALCDLQLQRACSMAKELGLPEKRCSANYEDLLGDPQVEAISIATPTFLHREMAVAALAAGKHVLVESPPALSMEEIDAMAAAERASGAVAMVAESDRYAFGARKALERIKEGRLGAVHLFEARSLVAVKNSPVPPWLLDPDQAGGGMWMADGVRYLSLARMLAGEIRAIRCRRVRPADAPTSAVDTVIAEFSFAGGAAGMILTSYELAARIYPNGWSVYGTAGAMFSRRNEPGRLTEFSYDESAKPIEHAAPPAPGPPETDGTGPMLAHFADSIALGYTPQTALGLERETMRAALAGTESMEKDEEVALEPR